MYAHAGSKTILAAIAAAVVCAACGGSNGEAANTGAAVAAASGIAGDYGGDRCLYDKLTFTDGGMVYLTTFGTDQAGEYKVDGERIVVTAGGQSMVFTKTGPDLEANVLGDRMICTALAASPGSERYEARTGEGRMTLELGTSGQARMTLTSAGGPDAGERMSFEVRYDARGDGVTIVMPGEEPLRFVRDGRDLVSTLDGETVRFIRQ